MDPEWIRRAEIGASEEIESSVRSALEKAQKAYRSDIFGFGELFRRHYPSQWRAVQKNWNDVFSGIDVRVHVRTRLKRPGVTNDSIPY
jgi:spore germination protein KC